MLICMVQLLNTFRLFLDNLETRTVLRNLYLLTLRYPLRHIWNITTWENMYFLHNGTLEHQCKITHSTHTRSSKVIKSKLEKWPSVQMYHLRMCALKLYLLEIGEILRNCSKTLSTLLNECKK